MAAKDCLHEVIMSPPSSIMWFRQDLRLLDNPALLAAASGGGAVIPAFIWSPEEEGNWPPGGASRWWLHQSLRSLSAGLEQFGSRLILRAGGTFPELENLARENGARAGWKSRGVGGRRFPTQGCCAVAPACGKGVF
jgi:deoxyribodipyrimidine photo-lyase